MDVKLGRKKTISKHFEQQVLTISIAKGVCVYLYVRVCFFLNCNSYISRSGKSPLVGLAIINCM